MQKHSVTTIGSVCMLLILVGAVQIPAQPEPRQSPCLLLDEEPPVITLVNPAVGYFHFSGIKLFPTMLNLVYDTMGFGGFRLRPVQVQVTDNVDPAENLTVYMYVYDNEQGAMAYNPQSDLFERKWIGPDLGVFTMNITAADTAGNVGTFTLDVWYFCFVPE